MQPDGYLWSGQTQSAWRTATHPLDGLNVVNVRFRIAFASDAQQQYDGFAFNNVRIEGRQEPPVTALEPTLAAQIRVYPKPANHALYIDLPEATREPVSLKIVDAYGRDALIGEIHRGQTGTAVDTQILAAGVYIIRLQTAGSTIHRKVMVVHE